MKKFLFSLLVLFAIFLLGCDNGSTGGVGNPFVGTWSGTVSGSSTVTGHVLNKLPATISFTNSNWTFKCPDAEINETGTYDRKTESIAGLNQGSTEVGVAVLSGNTLAVDIGRLPIINGNIAGGSFTK